MNPYLWQRRYQPHQTLNKPGRTIEDCTITYQHLRWVTNGTLPASPPAASVFVSHKNMDRDTGCPTPPSPKNSWFLGYKFATVFGYSSNINCISSQIEFVTQYCRWQVSLKLSVPVSRFRELVMQGQAYHSPHFTTLHNSELFNTADPLIFQSARSTTQVVGEHCSLLCSLSSDQKRIWLWQLMMVISLIAVEEETCFVKSGISLPFQRFCCSLRNLGKRSEKRVRIFPSTYLSGSSPKWIMIVTSTILSPLSSLNNTSAVLRELIGCRSQNTYIY